MAIQNKEILKSYFETGDTPTEQQFEDLIDSLSHVSESGSPSIWIDCDATLTNGDKHKAVMLGSDAKLTLYQLKPAYAGVKGKWEVTIGSFYTNNPEGNLTIQIVGTPVNDDSIYMPVNEGHNLTFKDSPSSSNEIQISSDNNTMAANLANAINALNINLNASSNNNEVLVSTINQDPNRNNWNIQFMQSNATGTNTFFNFEFVYSSGDSAALSFDVPDEDGFWFDMGSWRSSEPIDENDDATQLAQYINNNIGDFLTAVASNNVVTIEETSEIGGELSLEKRPDILGFNEINIPERSWPERTENIFIGLIKEVDEANNKCTLFGPGIVEGIASHDIDLPSITASLNSFEESMGLLVLPTNGGLVKLMSDNDFGAFPVLFLGAIGAVMSSALTGEKVIIKQIK